MAVHPVVNSDGVGGHHGVVHRAAGAADGDGDVVQVVALQAVEVVYLLVLIFRKAGVVAEVRQAAVDGDFVVILLIIISGTQQQVGLLGRHDGLAVVQAGFGIFFHSIAAVCLFVERAVEPVVGVGVEDVAALAVGAVVAQGEVVGYLPEVRPVGRAVVVSFCFGQYVRACSLLEQLAVHRRACGGFGEADAYLGQCPPQLKGDGDIVLTLVALGGVGGIHYKGVLLGLEVETGGSFYRFQAIECGYTDAFGTVGHQVKCSVGSH